MKAEIQKILEMSKAGTLSDEQASALLEEIALREKPAAPQDPGRKASPPGSPPFDFGKPISDFIQNAFGGAFSMTGMGGQDAQGNRAQMSKLETPSGKDFVFNENTVSLSSASRIELETAEMSGNSVNASKLDRLRIVRGKFTGSHVNGSSVERVEVQDGSIHALSVNGSKFSRFSLSGDSHVEGLHVDGSSFKSVTLSDRSAWSASGLGASALSDIQLVRSSIRDSRFDAAKISGLSLEDSVFEQVTIRALAVVQVRFAGCRIKNSIFAGGEGWRWEGFAKTRFEGCQFDSARFSGCRLKNTVIRNVTLKDIDVRDADLSGLTLDGNEAFLRAIGLKERA